MWQDVAHKLISSLPDHPYISAVIGAGASVASGLQTFRGKGGLYENARPEELASLSGFMEDPELVWSWYRDRMWAVFDAQPNAIHHSLVELEQHNLLDRIITQNVDGLHRLAGQSDDHLIEIHGNIVNTRCLDNCGATYQLDNPPESIPLECECGSYQRPAVVWFGEQLDYADLLAAQNSLDRVDLLMIIGTSGMVMPVSSMPVIAKRNGAILVDFNIEATPYWNIVDLFVEGPAEETVPEFIDIVIEEKSSKD